MHARSRRTFAVIAAAASLGAVSTASVVQTAGAATPSSPAAAAGLLDGLTPTQLTTLAPSLAGLDTSTLTDLLASAQAALTSAAPGADTGALQDLVNTLTGILGVAPVTPGTTAPPPPAGTAPVVRPPAPAPGVAGPRPSTRYRARLSHVKVAKNRRSVKVRITCPASAPKGCLVKLSGQVAGKRAAKAKYYLLLRNTSQTVTVKLISSGAKRLAKKGGSLKLTAKTEFSSLGVTSRTTKVARPRKHR